MSPTEPQEIHAVTIAAAAPLEMARTPLRMTTDGCSGPKETVRSICVPGARLRTFNTFFPPANFAMNIFPKTSPPRQG